MTVILGYIDDNKRYICADTQISSSYHKQYMIDSKIFKYNDFFLGVSGRIKLINAFNYWNPPKRKRGQYIHDYIEHTLIKSIQSLFKKEKVVGEEKGILDDTQSKIMIVTDSGIYIIQSDFSVYETLDNFAAIGCGDAAGFGALSMFHKLKKSKYRNISLDTYKALQMVVETVSDFDPYVGRVAHIFEEDKE